MRAGYKTEKFWRLFSGKKNLIILERTVRSFQAMNMKKKDGKFIVIDGTDGCGKATQTKILVKKLKERGCRVKTIDFPRYYHNFFGKFIGQCLAGEYGNFVAEDPHIASVLYAADRFESGNVIKKWLNDGNIVIADRYASSNQIHQGGKIKSEKERKEFIQWIEKMEFGVFGIPRPDVILYLDVPLEITQKLLAGKEKSKKKRYLNGKKDLHENDPGHLRDAKESAIRIIKRKNNWIRIDCVKDRQLMSRKEIGDIVWKNLKKLI